MSEYSVMTAQSPAATSPITFHVLVKRKASISLFLHQVLSSLSLNEMELFRKRAHSHRIHNGYSFRWNLAPQLMSYITRAQIVPSSACIDSLQYDTLLFCPNYLFGSSFIHCLPEPGIRGFERWYGPLIPSPSGISLSMCMRSGFRKLIREWRKVTKLNQISSVA